MEALIVAAAVAAFAFLLVLWAACSATAQYLDDKRRTKTGNFLLKGAK